MSLVSSRLSLKHLCTIERNTTATLDGWGNPAPPSYQPNLTNLPCRAWTTAGHETFDATTTVVIEEMHLLVASDTDVTEQDRIASVSYRGAAILAGPIGIRAVLRHQDHIELLLTRIA